MKKHLHSVEQTAFKPFELARTAGPRMREKCKALALHFSLISKGGPDASALRE
ncbi:MAG: hypothetical protein LBD40_02820 [Puniceicoccales bacterium]|nr:hypothetical protein [Puniceicoccales bacterium]